MLDLREHLRVGFYSGENNDTTWAEAEVKVKRCCEKAQEEMDKWVHADRAHVEDGLYGTIDDLKGWEAWTKTPVDCLNIDDMEPDTHPGEVDVVAMEVDEIHPDGEEDGNEREEMDDREEAESREAEEGEEEEEGYLPV